MFEWLESTPVALWVGVSSWAYSFLLSLHIVGLATVVGIFSVRDMRVVGMFSGLNPTAFLPISKLAWAGFGLNAGSGLLLFSSQAVTFTESIPFYVKIGAILIAMVLAGIIQTRLRGELAGQETVQETIVVSTPTRMIAGLSLCTWTIAIIAGRLIAYF